MSTKVVSGKNLGDSAEITYEPVSGGLKETIKSDIVLISTGRRPFTYNLGADKIGLAINKKG